MFLGLLSVHVPLVGAGQHERLQHALAMVRSVAEAAFPRLLGRKRKPWVSDATWRVVQERRVALNRTLRWEASRHGTLVRSICYVFRGMAADGAALLWQACQVHIGTLRAVAYLRRYSWQVRHRLQADRPLYVAGIAKEAAVIGRCRRPE